MKTIRKKRKNTNKPVTRALLRGKSYTWSARGGSVWGGK